MIPLRKYINKESLILMGIPVKFCDKTLDDFITYNQSLKTVKDFIRKYLNNIDSVRENNEGICFMGSNGVGKTFLSCLILKEAYRHRYSGRRVTFSQYISAYTDTWGNSKTVEQTILDTYKGVDFLVLEEIGKEIDSKIAKPILEDLLRYREENSLVTIICTNLTPDTLREVYGASVCSLINGNTTIITIESKDMR